MTNLLTEAIKPDETDKPYSITNQEFLQATGQNPNAGQSPATTHGQTYAASHCFGWGYPTLRTPCSIRSWMTQTVNCLGAF
jgi:hypothetical protein